MSLKFRLLIYINLLLLAAVFIGLAAIILSAQNNVRQEILSTQSLAVFAIENAIEKNPGNIYFKKRGENFGLSKLNELRHLKIKFYDENNQVRDRTSSDLSKIKIPPDWFIHIMEEFSKSLPEKKIFVNLVDKKLGYILINPEPLYEYSEIWQQITSGFLVILLFLGLVNIMIFIVFYHTLKPINAIIEGFQKLEDENYKAKINKTNILELDIIGMKFNEMVKKLREGNIKIHKLSQDLINVQEQEKKELARNLHDELGQSLTAIQAEAASIKRNKREESRILALESIISISKNMMLSTRELIKKLSLGILEEMGLEIAITDLVNNWSKRYPRNTLKYFYDKKLDNLIPASFEARIYRIIQEALTNIAKHSNPKNVNISLKLKKNKKDLEIKIFNDGVKSKLQKGSGIGLLGMTERVNQMKGTVNFKRKNNFEIIIVIKVAS
jgi:two-component system, NarL family, sensor histidine kinase UhpB